MAQKRAAGKPEEGRWEAAASRRTKPVKPADFKKGETSAKRMNQENAADRASRLQTRNTPGPRAQWKPGNMIYPVPAVLVTVADCEGNSNIITIAWTDGVHFGAPGALFLPYAAGER